ncbi:MAG: 2OG-Fe(II) oxygenase family protein [Rhodovibrionaceae bacterium]
MSQQVKTVDISALTEADGSARRAAERALGEAAEEMGFLCITGAPVAAVTAQARIAELLRIFELPEEEKHRLMNRKNVPEHDNAYRGYFGLQRGDSARTSEGYDMGSDAGPHGAADWIEELLMEPNVWPRAELLPGWRESATAHYREMEALGRLLMRSLGRYLGVGSDYFEPYFGEASTLRFLRALPRPDLTPDKVDEPRYRTVIDGKDVRLHTPAHRDSGVMTLLWQPGGLQAQNPKGDWVPAPKLASALNVNFGDCLEFWTGGRLGATAHRVLAQDSDRYSIPFFFEPRCDARIAPLPGLPEAPPIRYADHVFEKMKLFGTHATDRKETAA